MPSPDRLCQLIRATDGPSRSFLPIRSHLGALSMDLPEYSTSAQGVGAALGHGQPRARGLAAKPLHRQRLETQEGCAPQRLTARCGGRPLLDSLGCRPLVPHARIAPTSASPPSTSPHGYAVLTNGTDVATRRHASDAPPAQAGVAYAPGRIGTLYIVVGQCVHARDGRKLLGALLGSCWLRPETGDHSGAAVSERGMERPASWNGRSVIVATAVTPVIFAMAAVVMPGLPQ